MLSTPASKDDCQETLRLVGKGRKDRAAMPSKEDKFLWPSFSSPSPSSETINADNFTVSACQSYSVKNACNRSSGHELEKRVQKQCEMCWSPFHQNLVQKSWCSTFLGECDSIYHLCQGVTRPGGGGRHREEEGGREGHCHGRGKAWRWCASSTSKVKAGEMLL